MENLEVMAIKDRLEKLEKQSIALVKGQIILAEEIEKNFKLTAALSGVLKEYVDKLKKLNEKESKANARKND